MSLNQVALERRQASGSMFPSPGVPRARRCLQPAAVAQPDRRAGNAGRSLGSFGWRASIRLDVSQCHGGGSARGRALTIRPRAMPRAVCSGLGYGLGGLQGLILRLLLRPATYREMSGFDYRRAGSPYRHSARHRQNRPMDRNDDAENALSESVQILDALGENNAEAYPPVPGRGACEPRRCSEQTRQGLAAHGGFVPPARQADLGRVGPS